MNKVERTAAVYFALQGAAVVAWWAAISADEGFRSVFEMGPDRAVLSSFLLPDLVFLAPASFAAAWLCFKGHEHKGIVSWLATGLITYPTVYNFAYSLQTDVGWWGVVSMAPATLWSGVFAFGVSAPGKQMFRQTREGSGGWMFAKTLTQIVVVWSLILGLFPYLIVIVERKLGIPQFEFPFQIPVTVALFVLASIPGVWSAWVMSVDGKGTPLPLDHASKLVVSGPYRYLRNPMAFSGICQGLVVALAWGSPLVAAYALIGSLVWQLVFRPLEEEDLENRFGEEYLEYKEAVRCWVPSISRFQPQRKQGTESE